MANRKLTKRNYLGDGYVHIFKNDTNGEITYIPTTKEQFESMSGKDGHLNNPTLAGHTLVGSGGGTIKVDTPNTMLGDDEYCIVGEEAHIVLAGEVGEKANKRVPKADVDAQGNYEDGQGDNQQ